MEAPDKRFKVLTQIMLDFLAVNDSVQNYISPDSILVVKDTNQDGKYDTIFVEEDGKLRESYTIALAIYIDLLLKENRIEEV